MTDEMRAREKAICEAAKVDDIGEVSDGFHTFNSLYEQRMILFAALVKAYKDKSWKSYRHENGELCFGGGWFIVGIDTPEGSYTYHYEDNYYSLFDCEELERGKHWDGHTEKDVTRLLSLPRTQLSQQGTTSDLISRQAAIDAIMGQPPELHYPSWYAAQIEKLPAVQPVNMDETPVKNASNSTSLGSGEGKLDLISRRAAIDALHMHLMYRMGTDSNKKRLDEWINNLPPAQPEQRWIPCGKCIHADGKHRRCKVLDRAINEDYFCYWAEPYRGGEKE